jgi:hypothetical protein
MAQILPRAMLGEIGEEWNRKATFRKFGAYILDNQYVIEISPCVHTSGGRQMIGLTIQSQIQSGRFFLIGSEFEAMVIEKFRTFHRLSPPEIAGRFFDGLLEFHS